MKNSDRMAIAFLASALQAASFCMAAGSVSLDGDGWRLDYRLEEEGGAWKSVPATVPGDAYLALEAAGAVPPLMKGTNVWGMFRYEQCEWKYSRTFDAPKVGADERLQLRFDGVDTRATYYLNGEEIGRSANMHVPVLFDITGKVKPTGNELAVRIASPLGCDLLPVPGRTREGGTDVEGVRKAMHMFGWDIMPRVVSGGIWRSVALDVLPAVRFGDVHWMTFEADPTNRTARIRIDCQILAPRRHLHRAKLRLSLARNGRTAWRKEHVVRFYQTVDRETVTDADLWWPRGSGEPVLYDAVAEFVGEDGTVLARDARKFGLRTVKLERADWHSEKDPGTFRFIVNGEPVFMHGCDWSPLDALHSRDGRHLFKACEMLRDLNCNMVRMWGGGVYEPDAFFDYCDANGILVWQDFAMGNVNPPQDDGFAREIYREAKSLILRLRSHPSLAIWCANNEIDRAIGYSMAPFAPDPNAERVSREILPRVLREFDPLRPYLPSSPYRSPEVAAGKARLSQDHIWCWKFGRDAEFTASTVTFVGEMGRHGCPNLDSLRKMMNPDCVYPWPDPANPDHFNDEWNCKCARAYPDYPEWSGDGRNAALVRGCRNYYGTVPTNLTDFVAASQFVQANDLKTWIELYRSRKGRMWGVLWWNLRDGWPIISDGVVDWYFGKKRAYYAIRESQRPQLVCAVYDPDLRAVAVNDARHAVRGRVKITDRATGRVLLDRAFAIAANGKTELGPLAVKGRGFLAIDCEIDGKSFANWFLYGEPPFDVKVSDERFAPPTCTSAVSLPSDIAANCEAWLCAGQSNMQRGWGCFDKTPEEQARVRRELAQLGAVDVRLWNFADGSWTRLDATNALACSAVGVSFAIRRAQATRKPVAILYVAAGGAPTESFLSRELMSSGKYPTLAAMMRDGREIGENAVFPCTWVAREYPRLRATDAEARWWGFGCLYEKGIAPLADVPLTGILWYQGESNATACVGDSDRELDAGYMRETLRAAVEQLRGTRRIPFLMVGLPRMNRPWEAYRAAQKEVCRETGAVYLDTFAAGLGEPDDVHPRNKIPFAEMAAAAASAASGSSGGRMR